MWKHLRTCARHATPLVFTILNCEASVNPLSFNIVVNPPVAALSISISLRRGLLFYHINPSLVINAPRRVSSVHKYTSCLRLFAQPVSADSTRRGSHAAAQDVFQPVLTQNQVMRDGTLRRPMIWLAWRHWLIGHTCVIVFRMKTDARLFVILSSVVGLVFASVMLVTTLGI